MNKLLLSFKKFECKSRKIITSENFNRRENFISQIFISNNYIIFKLEFK